MWRRDTGLDERVNGPGLGERSWVRKGSLLYIAHEELCLPSDPRNPVCCLDVP